MKICFADKMSSTSNTENFAISKAAVLAPSTTLPENTPTVLGYEWNGGINYHEIFKSYKRSGFQATNFGLAVEEIQKMIDCRKVSLAQDKIDTYEDDEFIKRKHNCTIFLGYTSNLISCGLRETIRFLVQHSMVCLIKKMPTEKKIEYIFLGRLYCNYSRRNRRRFY